MGQYTIVLPTVVHTQVHLNYHDVSYKTVVQCYIYSTKWSIYYLGNSDLNSQKLKIKPVTLRPRKFQPLNITNHNFMVQS